MNIALRTASIVAALVLSLPACLDYRTIAESDVSHEPIVADTSDAGAEASTAGSTAHAACLECAKVAPDAGAGCGDLFATCAADTKCNTMFACAVASGCFVAGVAVASCLTPCGEKAGVTSSADPVIGRFTPLYLCAVTTCSAACSE